MADFCTQCSIEIFGEDGGDLSGITNEKYTKKGIFVAVICEGCGLIQVDHTGKCVANDCLKKHGDISFAPPPDFTEINDLIAEHEKDPARKKMLDEARIIMKEEITVLKNEQERLDHLQDQWEEDRKYLVDVMEQYNASKVRKGFVDSKMLFNKLKELSEHIPSLADKLKKYIGVHAFAEGMVTGQAHKISQLEERIVMFEKKAQELLDERQAWLDSADPNAGPYVPWDVYEKAIAQSLKNK